MLIRSVNTSGIADRRAGHHYSQQGRTDAFGNNSNGEGNLWNVSY